MAWTADIYPRIQPYQPNAFHLLPALCLQAEPHYTPASLQASQQPTAVLQQLPSTMTPPHSAPSIRPGGHVKEDLVALMMIQNAQMHQAIVSSITTSTLGSLGLLGPGTDTEPPRDIVLIQENEGDPEVHHHYYQLAPRRSSPWAVPRATALYQEDLNQSGCAPPHGDRPAVRPLPPSLTAPGTRAVNTTAASENMC